MWPADIAVGALFLTWLDSLSPVLIEIKQHAVDVGLRPLGAVEAGQHASRWIFFGSPAMYRSYSFIPSHLIPAPWVSD